MHSNHCLIALLLTTVLKCVYCLDLRGVTVVSRPFVTQVNNNFDGYCIDLMQEISKIMKFNYTLYPSPDGKYGYQDQSGRPNGLIQELLMKRADFAIADLTKGDTRERFVDFTESFMNLDLTALIHKKNIGHMVSFSDLYNQTNTTYGYLREGETQRFMQMSSDQTIMNLQSYVYRNGYNLVNSRQEGIDRALNTNYAFIQESVANEYAMDQNCDLTVIDDRKEYYPREYAIGLQKGSIYKPEFDNAIRQLKVDGTLDKLKRKYFHTKCYPNSDTRLDGIRSMGLIVFALISYVVFN